jgi:hypothetical protein
MVELNDPSYYCERPNCSLPRKLVLLGALVLLFVFGQQFTALRRVIQKEDHRDKRGNHDFVWSPPRALVGQFNGDQKNNHRENVSIRFGLADTKWMNASSPTFKENRQPLDRYDVTAIRRQSPRNKNRKDIEQCKISPGLGAEGTEGFQGLIKIQIYNASTTTWATFDEHPTAGVVPPRVSPTLQKSVLCIVLTDSTRHAKVLQAIVDTYAPRCDGFLAASNQSDPSLGAVDLFSGVQKTYRNHRYWEWQLIRQVWHYVYDKYRNDFDFFHLGPDNMFVIPENLRYFLSTYFYDETPTNLRKGDEDSSAEKDPSTNVVEEVVTTDNDATTTTTTRAAEDLPLYLGGAVVASRVFPERRHCGGGAGYSLNRAALTLFQTQLSNQTCQDATSLLQQRPQLWDTNTTGVDSIKATMTVSVDRLMAECFAAVNIFCAKTSDSQFAVRYLEFGIDYQARWSKQLKGPIKYNPLRVHHGIYMNSGIRGISTSAVSIHLVNGVEPLGSPLSKVIRRVDMVLNRRCHDQWDKHVGALDGNGKPGYVHDATYIRNNPPPFRFDKLNKDIAGVCEVPLGKGPEDEMGLVALQKIRIMNTVAAGGAKLPRVICLIYTHSNRHDRVRAIAETFAPRCGKSVDWAAYTPI